MDNEFSEVGGERHWHLPDSSPLQSLGPDTHLDSPVPKMGDQTHSAPLTSNSKSTRGRTAKALGGAALFAALFVVGRPVWKYLHSYETTDDVQIDGHIVPISSRIDGTIAHVYVEETQTVKSGQLLAAIDSHDEQVAVENARANLFLAEAQADSARADYQAALD
jgi:membrane fusion protein (multidrug efflux system)